MPAGLAWLLPMLCLCSSSSAAAIRRWRSRCAAAITTRAVRTTAGWQISGRKAWVSLASEADLFLVVAKTELAPGHRDIAVFAVDAHDGGVTFPTLYDKACAA